MYGGDELGMTGSETSCHNIDLQNRNMLIWDKKGHYTKNLSKNLYNDINNIMKLRNDSRLKPLNDGTPYMLNPQTPSTISGRPNKEGYTIPSYLMQDSSGAMTISLFNSIGVDIDNNGNYTPYKAELNGLYIGPDNAITLKEGTQFKNIASDDNTIYTVKYIDSPYKKGYFLEKTDGSNIILDTKTAPDGVMILYHIPEKNSQISFKGQLPINFNPAKTHNYNNYCKPNNNITGNKLSLTSK